MRVMHERAREQMDRSIAERQKLGASLDDSAGDWRQDCERHIADFKAAKDRLVARAALQRAFARSMEGLVPLEPYEPSPTIEGVHLRLRPVTQTVVFASRAAIIAAGADAEGDSSAERAARLMAMGAQHEAIRPFIKRVMGGVKGVRHPHGTIQWEGAEAPDELLDLLDEAGVLGAIFTACREFQSIADPKEREVFGLPQPSTSAPLTAAGVQGLRSPSFEVVMAAPPPSTSAAPSTRPIDVLDVINSTSPGPAPHSVFTESRTALPESPGSTSQT
jgi:hypothetical protein